MSYQSVLDPKIVEKINAIDDSIIFLLKAVEEQFTQQIETNKKIQKLEDIITRTVLLCGIAQKMEVPS
jgi:hypothetical protein